MDTNDQWVQMYSRGAGGAGRAVVVAAILILISNISTLGWKKIEGPGARPGPTWVSIFKLFDWFGWVLLSNLGVRHT